VRCVVDCSVALKWFFREPQSDIALTLLDRLQRGTLQMIAPDCIVAELGHALRKLVVGGKLSPQESYAAIDEFTALPIALEPSRVLARNAMEMAVEHMATFYDALYVALAFREDVKVLTADERMVRAFARLDRATLLSDFPTTG
jgi:predicted nucleic acid-binding protein